MDIKYYLLCSFDYTYVHIVHAIQSFNLINKYLIFIFKKMFSIGSELIKFILKKIQKNNIQTSSTYEDEQINFYLEIISTTISNNCSQLLSNKICPRRNLEVVESRATIQTITGRVHESCREMGKKTLRRLKWQQVWH